MFQLEKFLYAVSLVLQLAAMLFALRMGRRSVLRRPWFVMATALAIMSAFRVVALFSTGEKPIVQLRGDAFRLFTANVSMATSALLFLALFATRRLSLVQESAESARRAAERSLRESELRLRAMFEQTFGFLAILKPDGAVIDVNHAPLEVGGFQKEDQIGKPFWETGWFAQSPEIRAQLKAGIQAAARGVQGRYESTYHTAAGELRAVDRSISPIRDEAGHVVFVIVESRDITDRKRAEEGLRRAKQDAESANAAKDQFLAVLSHELRTPLTPVLLTVSMMQEDDDLPKRVRDELGTIRRNVEMEARLIDDLLDMTRITRGKLQLHTAPVNVHVLIRAAHDICSAPGGGGAQITLRLNASHHWLRADAARLQQVFWNLLTNAKKFTKSEGRIDVVTSDVVGGRLRIEVVDSGIGIDPEMLPRVFQAFEQGEATARRFGGLGLGLAICKALVEMHGGTIEAQSEGTGYGARFVVELPNAQGTPAEGGGGSGGSNGAGKRVAGPLRILVVEDHETTSLAMKKLLVAMGHQATTASTAAQAEAVWQRGQYDLLISDLGLPDASGHELMRRLRAHRPVRGIAVSGFGQAEDVQRSNEAGFVAHVTKPLDARRLETMIAEAMKAEPKGANGGGVSNVS
jgi:PAS domain S-box-containing protein